MSIFIVLDIIGGLSLFLFGMNLMGNTLRENTGDKLKAFFDNMISTPIRGFVLGTGATALMQSSSATTVMIVGFVNAGTMSLGRAVSVIMGANVGTTVTSWLTGLSGVSDSGAAAASVLKIFKPSSFVPILALIGVVLYMFGKSDRKKSIGVILLGFSIIMIGMEMMSDAVKPLGENERFRSVLLWFENPLLGVFAGAIMTAIIQSSSAAVGIVQSLTVTGAITVKNAVPILLGQNIGTCVTVIIASIGANANAKRAAFIHFYFNIIGVVVFLTLFETWRLVAEPAFMQSSINTWGIAFVHTVFNLVSVIILSPFSKYLERLTRLTIRDKSGE